jgi:ferric-dicitrate binding protein FerR (iron transport regulator)
MPNPDRAAALALAHLDGSLGPDGLAELSALLLADPAAAEAFVRVCRADGLLAEAFRDTYRLAPVRPAPVRRRRRVVRATVVRGPRWPLALAASLLVAAVVGYAGYRPEPPEAADGPAPARLARAVGCRWDGPAPGLGGGVAAGQRFQLLDGMAELTFDTGVRVTLTAGAGLTVVSAGAVRLDAGAVTADVPPAGVGFRVETPAGVVTDLGTWFRARVEKDGSTTVDVYEGAVAVAPAGGGAEARVAAPDAVRLTPAGAAPNGVAVRPEGRRLFPGVAATERVRAATIPDGAAAPRAFPPAGVSVVQERTDHRLTREVRAGPFRPGEYLAAPPPDGAVPADKRVHSYLIHLGAGAAEGKVEFLAPVLGVVRTSAGLAASDGELTAAKFDGWGAGRGWDGTAADGDSLWLNPNRKSLWVRRTGGPPAQFRVLLEAEE